MKVVVVDSSSRKGRQARVWSRTSMLCGDILDQDIDGPTLQVGQSMWLSWLHIFRKTALG